MQHETFIARSDGQVFAEMPGPDAIRVCGPRVYGH